MVVYFSGMVNCANIDWFFPWPEQALYAVASVFISPDVSMSWLYPINVTVHWKLEFWNKLHYISLIYYKLSTLQH